MPPLLRMTGRGEHRESKNSKQETDQTVLTITKALTETAHCTHKAKKSGTALPSLSKSFRRHWAFTLAVVTNASGDVPQEIHRGLRLCLFNLIESNLIQSKTNL